MDRKNNVNDENPEETDTLREEIDREISELKKGGKRKTIRKKKRKGKTKRKIKKKKKKSRCRKTKKNKTRRIR
tara:strand:- start:6 stop:224 length:219 start_codon:yes stop_codon:yes gene_type:complete